MTTTKSYLKHFTILMTALFFTANVNAQCEGFDNYPDGKAQAMEDHVVYRGFVKAEEYDKAFPLWEKLYKHSPSGHEYHFVDGIEMYRDKFEKATEDAQKKEIITKLREIYAGRRECFGEKVSKKTGRKRIGYFYSLEAADLYYMGAENSAILETYDKAFELEGEGIDFDAMVPYTELWVDQYIEEGNGLKRSGQTMSDEFKAKGRDKYNYMIKLADKFLAEAEDEESKTSAKEVKDYVQGKFSEVDIWIFDCAYFVGKIKGEYEANPDDKNTIMKVYNDLKGYGCTTANPFMSKLETKYKSIVRAENEAAVATAKANSPMYQAQTAQKAGNLPEAINWYQKAANEKSGRQKAEIEFRIARIYRQQGKKNEARKMLRQIMSTDPSWGEPYLELGKLYAGSGRSCKASDPFLGWAVSWVAVDQFQKAKSVDPSLAGEANSLIGKYSAYYPPKAEGFMRKLKDGQSFKVGCWIGETTTVRLK